MSEQNSLMMKILVKPMTLRRWLKLEVDSIPLYEAVLNKFRELGLTSSKSLPRNGKIWDMINRYTPEVSDFIFKYDATKLQLLIYIPEIGNDIGFSTPLIASMISIIGQADTQEGILISGRFMHKPLIVEVSVTYNNGKAILDHQPKNLTELHSQFADISMCKNLLSDSREGTIPMANQFFSFR